MLIITHLLTLPEGSNEYVMYCDASTVNVGFVLMHRGKFITNDSRELKDACEELFES